MNATEVTDISCEVLPPGVREEHLEGVNQAPPSPYERRKPVLELLEASRACSRMRSEGFPFI